MRSTDTGLEADRSRSPGRSRQILASDVDPDQIRFALRDHSQYVLQIERERVCLLPAVFVLYFHAFAIRQCFLAGRPRRSVVRSSRQIIHVSH